MMPRDMISAMPENGMKVIAHGRVSVFVRDGQYIYYCDRLEPDGIGALYLAYEQLKKKLEQIPPTGAINKARRAAIIAIINKMVGEKK